MTTYTYHSIDWACDTFQLLLNRTRAGGDQSAAVAEFRAVLEALDAERAARAEAEAKVEQYKSSLARHVQYDMRALLTDTPEHRDRVQTEDATVKHIVEWLHGLEERLAQIIEREGDPQMRARRGIYEGIAEDVLRGAWRR